MKTIIEFIKFSIIGAINTAIHATIFLYLTQLGYLQLSSNITAFLIAASFSCLANTFWSFQSKLSLPIIRRFFIVSSIGFMFTAALSATADYATINRYITIMCVILVLPVVNFIGHKYWTYNVNHIT